MVPVAVDTDERCQHDRPVQLITASPGLISGSALLHSGRCVWQVTVGRGQRVRFRPDVFRPGASKSLVIPVGAGSGGDALPAEGENGVGTGTACSWLLSVDGDRDGVVRVPLCSRTSSRQQSIECRPRGPAQQSCSVFLDWPDGFTDEDFPVFVVHYEGIVNCVFLQLSSD